MPSVSPARALGRGGAASQRPRSILIRGRGFAFEMPLGNGRVTPTSGGAIIGEGARPQQTPLSIYEGEARIRLDVPVFLDGWPDRDQQPHLDQILNLCVGTDGERPPDFTASGPMPFSGMRFQMDGLPEYGDGWGSPDGQIVTVRQSLIVHLAEFEDADVIHARKVKGRDARNSNGGTFAPGSIDLPHPMTLIEVASKYMGDPARAKEIGKLNGVRDVTQKLKAGRHLKLPGG